MTTWQTLMEWTEGGSVYRLELFELRSMHNERLTHLKWTRDGQPHNAYGPARIYQREDGTYNILYYINGLMMSRDEWLLSVSGHMACAETENRDPIRVAEDVLYDALMLTEEDKLSLKEARNAMAVAASAISEHITNMETENVNESKARPIISSSSGTSGNQGCIHCLPDPYRTYTTGRAGVADMHTNIGV